jgi:succinate dehydrogenase/fumarate reductase flavoprotein subunit
MKKGLAIEIAPHCHFTMGGMRINTKCATNIAGLYAAGECAGGLHGANRIAGAALTQTLVQGAIAGETAAKYALKARQVNANEKELRKIKERVFEPLNRNEGIRPVQLRKKIQEVAFLNAGPVRDSSGLEKTIKEIETIKKQDMPRIHVDAKDPVYNLEWVEAFQAVNLLQVLELVTRSAYLRRESRGAHYRRDHTYVDNRNWLRNIVIRRGEDGRARTATRPVIVTRIRLPPRSTKPYPG